MASSQTSHSIINAKCEIVEQNENEGYTEYKDKKKIQRNDTESEIERLRKILYEQNHPRRLKKSLGKENSPQRQKQLSQTQEYKPNDQELWSNREDERTSKHEELQIQAKSGRTVVEKIVSEHKETSNEQEESIRVNEIQSNDQVEKITKKKTQNTKENSKTQVICLESEKGILEQEIRHIANKRKTDNKNVRKSHYQNPEDKTDMRIKGQSVEKDDLQTSFIVITNDMDFTFLSQQHKIQDIEEQVGWSTDKIYPHNTEIRTPDGCGPAICGTYQQQISPESSDIDTDECDFANNLTRKGERNNLKSESNCNVNEKILISRSSSNENEVLNTGNDMRVKETPLEFTKGKRDEVHADLECKIGHTYVNDAEVYSSENRVYADDTENTSSVIIVDDSFNVYGQLFTRIKLKSGLNDSIEHSQVKTEHQGQGRQLNYPDASNNIEPMHKSTDLEIPEDLDEDNSPNFHHAPFKGSTLSGNTGHLDRLDTVYNTNVGYSNRRVDSSSLRRDTQSQSSSSYHPGDGYKDKSCQLGSSYHPGDGYKDNICQSGSSYHPGDGYKDNISQSGSSYHPGDGYKDNICQSGSSSHPGDGYKDNICQSGFSYHPDNGYKDNIRQSSSTDASHLKSVENQSHLATSVQQQQTRTLQEQVDVDSPLEDCKDRNHRSEGDLVSNLNALAKHLGFIVKDVIPDGNCMFSAIVDQLRISGNLDFTPQTLRIAAVSQLRNNPINADGTHMESFLYTESWETYLTRMAQEYVWGDHLALQACAEVTGYRIHVIKCPLLITKLEPASSEPEQYSILYLGHVSESHFISLRQKNWEETWYIKAKVRELQKHFPMIITSLTTKELMVKRNKFNHLFADVKLLKTTMRKLDCDLDDEEKRKREANKSPGIDQGDNALVRVNVSEGTSQSPEDIGEKEIELPTDDEWEELENWLSFTEDYGLTQDSFGIDSKSGVSLVHLSSLVRYFVSDEGVLTRLYIHKDSEYKSKDAKYIGSIPEDLRIRFPHYQAFSEKYCNCEKKVNRSLKIVYIDRKSRVQAEGTEGMKISDLVSETELCNPGYTLLCPCDLNHRKKELVYINWRKPVLRCRDFMVSRDITTAFACVSWPESTSEWTSRDRPSGWPKHEHIIAMKTSECLVIPKPHPKSALPECEWQFIFPDAEMILAKDCLSEMQKYCFSVFKILVDFYLRDGQIRLTTTHLKTVMYFACEVIPQSCWSENVGGCLLYLLERLGKCLSEKNLPNYFINENNMINHFTDDQISWAVEKLLILRLFPMLSIMHFADHHGLAIVSSVLADRGIQTKIKPSMIIML